MNLIFENKVKSLSEFCIINCINNRIVIEQLNRIQHLYLVSRGGDALNYYFNDFTPTHDWDFGLVTITNGNLLTQEEFNIRIHIVEIIGRYFAQSLTTYFRDNVLRDGFRGIEFNFRWLNSRLSHILFNYTLGGLQYTNAVIDIYIHDLVQDGTRNASVPHHNNNIVINDQHWFSKIQEIENLTFDEVMNVLPNYNQNLKLTLFPNKIESVVQDITTRITYISPGDLFNDTLRMIYSSIYNINVDPHPRNNKLVKYMKKLSKLIDIFNNIGICPNQSCRYNNVARILSRDTNTLDCQGNIINNTQNFKMAIIESLRNQRWVNIIDQHMINLTSSKKLCEIQYVLSL